MALPTPHFDKLNALLDNDKLPGDDKERIDHAIEKYHEWIKGMTETGRRPVRNYRSVSFSAFRI